jgi:Ca-activated chloride channel family protein
MIGRRGFILAAAAFCALVHALTASGDDLWVSFISPKQDQPVIGEILVEANVLSVQPIRDVTFYMDGRQIGSLASAPYRLRLDLGEENKAHTFEVVATDVNGTKASASVTTTPAPIAGSIEVELQQLYVTVTENDGRVVELTRDDFVVKDDGRQQELVTFSSGDVPFTAVLLIDASASMYGTKLEAARAGATSFINGMRELDRGKVMVFSDVIQNTTPFSSVHEVLAAGLTGATGAGGTSLNDYLYMSLKLLESQQGRRVVVLLSDGVDSHSALRTRQVLDRARRSQALLYWIRLERTRDPIGQGSASQLASAWKGPPDYQQHFDTLTEMVRGSGGRIIDAHTPEDIQPVFLEILQELREQYALGYYPDNRRNDGSWRKVKVEVSRPGVAVRTHEGYVDL